MIGVRLLPLMLASLLLSGCGDEPLKRFSLTEQAGVFAASIDNTGERIAVGTVSHGGSLWRLEDSARLFDWNHGDDANSLIVATAFSPDARTALTAERNSVVIWDVENGTPRHLFGTEGDVLSAALSNDGRHALLGLRNQNALLVHTDGSRSPALIAHAGFVTSVAISADGQLGVTGSDDGMLRVWNLQTGEALLAERFAAAISVITLSDDGTRLFAAAAHHGGKVWDLTTLRPISEIGRPRSSIVSARFSSDNATLLTGLPAASIALWRVQDGAELKLWTAPRDTFWRATRPAATAVSFSDRTRSVIAAMSDGSVMIWGM